MSDFQNRLGHDNFIWWLGVVEDRQDPLNLGRCRVRIFGSHTENLNEIPTDDLPWAQTIVPVNQALVTGSPMEGDYVFGFFFDGLNSQSPCILGVLPGIPQQFSSASKGFMDNRTADQLTKSPKKPVINGSNWSEGEASLNPTVVGEPTTSRLSRNEKLENTLIGYRKETLDENVPTSTGASWSEPTTEYKATAPFNRVLETESGHIMEFDDTPEGERINLTHRKGTFFEIYPDGSKVTKVVGKDYEIILSDKNVHVKGVCNITVDGDANLYVKGGVVEKVDGDYLLNVTGDIAINGKTINLNKGTMGAARVGDTADTGDEGTGGHFDTNSPGTNKIESGSGTVFIGD